MVNLTAALIAVGRNRKLHMLLSNLTHFQLRAKSPGSQEPL